MLSALSFPEVEEQPTDDGLGFRPARPVQAASVQADGPTGKPTNNQTADDLDDDVGFRPAASPPRPTWPQVRRAIAARIPARPAGLPAGFDLPQPPAHAGGEAVRPVNRVTGKTAQGVPRSDSGSFHPGVQPQTTTPTMVSAYSPTAGERLLSVVRNSPIGHTIQTTLPGLPDWLKPTTSNAAPEYKEEQQGFRFEPLVRGVTQDQVQHALDTVHDVNPLIPPVRLPAATFRATASDQATPTESRLVGAARNLSDQTSAPAVARDVGIAAAATMGGELLGPALMAAGVSEPGAVLGVKIAHALAGAGFTAQMGIQLARQVPAYRRALNDGDERRANELIGSMLVDGTLTALSAGGTALGAHGIAKEIGADLSPIERRRVEAYRAWREAERQRSARLGTPPRTVEPEPGPVERGGNGSAGRRDAWGGEARGGAGGVRAAEDAPEVPEATPQRSVLNSGSAWIAIRRAQHPKITPEGRDAGLATAQHPAMQAAMEEATQQPQPVGAAEPETGRTIVQPTDDPAANQAITTSAMPAFQAGLANVLKDVPGAAPAAVREEKNPARLAEKIHDEGKPAETVGDYGAMQVKVDSPAAREAAVAAIKAQFPIVAEDDRFDEGDADYGYRNHSLQVQTPSGASVEVQVVPKEVLEANPEQHHDYKAAREARIAGDASGFAQDAAAAKRKNDAAMAAFVQRNRAAKEEPNQRSEAPQAKATAESRTARIAAGQQVLVYGRREVPDGTLATIHYWNDGLDNRGNRFVRGRGSATLPDGAVKTLDTLTDDQVHRIEPVKVWGPQTGTALESELSKRAEAEGTRLVAEYLQKNTPEGTLNVATDEAKRLFPEYVADPTRVDGDVSSAASAIAHAAWRTAIARAPEPGWERVKIAVGSPASGKTSGLMTSQPKYGIVREAIPQELAYIEQMADQAIASGRRPQIELVFTDTPVKNVQRMVKRAIKTGRPVTIDYMAKAYVTVPKVVAEFAAKHGNRIRVHSFDNSGTEGEAKLYTGTVQPAVDALSRWTEQRAREAMYEELERLYRAGRSPGPVYHAALSRAGVRSVADAGRDRGGGQGRPAVPGGSEP